MQMAGMETNAAYDCIQRNAAATEDNIYELDDVNLAETFKSSSTFSPAEVEIKKRDTETKEKKNFCFILLNTITAVTALLLALVFLSFFLVHYATYQQLLETQQSASIETMQLLLNSSNEQLQLQAAELKEAQNFIQNLQLQLNSSNEQLRLQASELKEAQNFIQNLRLQLNSSNEQLQLQASELKEAQNFIQNLQLQLNSSNEQLQLQASELKEAQNFIQNLQLQLNSSIEQLQHQASELKEAKRFIQSLQLQLNKTVDLRESLQNDFQLFIEEQQTNELLTHNRFQGIEQDLDNLFIHSCKDLPQGSPSGYYPIPTNDTGVIHVYCSTSPRYCSCSTSGGWMRVANFDMTDPTQQCPDGFKQIDRTEPPVHTCGRPDGTHGCVSTTFKAYGVEYSRVCGRIVGYQIGSPSAFRRQYVGINSHYASGISLTHGQPRQHIYTFANAQGEGYTSEVCPCNQGGTDTSVPQFVGSDYFCDSAVRGSNATVGVFYSYDPLWDGQGCGSNSTCCEFNNPPWFCKQLPQPTTNDIELRLCENGPPEQDDSLFEKVELYIN